MTATVAIVGAGSVGVNAALFLHRLGLQPILFDAAHDILHGAAEASFINHGDGFEYYKRHHRGTGETCIDGSLTKGLLYPLRKLATPVCSEERPIRFLVAERSVGVEDLTVGHFADNVRHMHQHFSRQFHSLRAACEWPEDEAERRFLRRPATFARRLGANEYVDVKGIALAYAGSSFGINMPHYYALLKAAMRACGIEFHAASPPAAFEKSGKRYRIEVGGGGRSTPTASC